MKLTRPAALAYSAALLVIALDQLTKYWVVNVSGLLLEQTRELSPVFDLTYILNTGISFGALSGGQARWGLSFFALLVAIVLVYFAWLASRQLLGTAIGLIIGGAVGNLIDRVRIGAVIDFLDFSDLYFPFVFNVADAAITTGVALLLLDMHLNERKAPVGEPDQTG